jgi:hypothetical protein
MLLSPAYVGIFFLKFICSFSDIILFPSSSFRFDESERIKKPDDLEMGDLFDSISGDGFTTKHKRSGQANVNNLRLDRRVGARFQRIPSLELLDSD